MVYLTFDTNFWIHDFPNEFWKKENSLDNLELWVKEKDVQVLLPKIVIDEWKKGREKDIKKIEEDLTKFFSSAEIILPPIQYAPYKDSEKRKELILKHFQRIKKLIDNAQVIHDNEDIDAKLLKWTKEGLAPMHTNKNSRNDAIIILSLIDFANKNKGNTSFFFISNNYKDFSNLKKHNEIHPDLKPDFDELNITYIRTIKHVIDKLQGTLKLPTPIQKIKKQIYHPEYEKLTTELESGFIPNSEMINFILSQKKPTKEQVIFVLALIDSDFDYEREFYKKLENPNWFKILKMKGVFHPSNNPSPIQGEEKGFYSIPVWEALKYLELLSLKIKNGEELHLTGDMIEIISNISKKSKGNYRTWEFIIKILVNLSNDKVSKEILDFIPTWLSGNFDTVLQSHALLEKLLPKFLYDEATGDDIEKVEIILKHLFAIQKEDKTKRGYTSRVRLYALSHELIGRKRIAKIAQYCSDDIIIYLADNLKKLRFDFPDGISQNFTKEDGTSLEIKVLPQEKNLKIEVSKRGDIIDSDTLLNFENLDKEELKKKLISILKQKTISFPLSKEDNNSFMSFIISLVNGSLESYFYFSSISERNKDYGLNDDVTGVFTSIFIELLNERIKQNSKQGLDLLKKFAFDSFYQLSFFRKIALFAISENWKICKSVFWEMIVDNDKNGYFSYNVYRKDIYELLNKNHKSLTHEELEKLKIVIDNGNQYQKEDGYPKYMEHWRFYWYSALRNTTFFEKEYQEHSKIFNSTYERFENEGKIRYTGITSPFSSNEILQKSSVEIIEFIHNFNPKDTWEEPSIHGLTAQLTQAVEVEPQKFVDEIELYQGLYYTYIHSILYGLTRTDKSFSQKKALHFCKGYISSEKFHSEELILENDSVSSNSQQIISSITDLLRKSINSDNKDLLPIIKEILQLLIPELKPSEKKEKEEDTDNDLIYHSTNPTVTGVLSTLLNYTIKIIQNKDIQLEVQPKWNNGIKRLFEKAFELTDSYTFLGNQFGNFHYFDRQWTFNLVKKIASFEDEKRIDFFSCYLRTSPFEDENIYDLFYSYYEKEIKGNNKIKKALYKGLTRHVIDFYFYGFEDLKNENGLLLPLLKKTELSFVLEIIKVRYKEYYESLPKEKKNKFEKNVFELWKYLITKYDKLTSEEKEGLLENFLGFLPFVSQLDENYIAVILKSITPNSHYDYHIYLKNLIRLKTKGNPIKIAKYIGQVLNSITNNYFSLSDRKRIVELVTFLYENEQTQIANDFCNKVTKQGHEFLIEVYKNYQ